MIRAAMVMVLAGGLSAAVLTGAVAASGDEKVRLAAEGAAESREGIRTFRTRPAGEVWSREERERSYRSCLFTYLPQIGSDVAAEMIRDACRDEFPEQD